MPIVKVASIGCKFWYTSTTLGLPSIVMSMSVSLSVCPLAYLKNHTAEVPQIFVLVPVSVSRSSCYGITTCYVIPVLRMTPSVHTMGCTMRHVYS